MCAFQLKHVRSVLCCGALDVSDLHQQLRSLDVGLHVSVKNLRSQVVREACITIASVSYLFSLVTYYCKFLNYDHVCVCTTVGM